MVAPAESVVEDSSLIQSINEIGVNDLVLGITATDFEKYPDHPAADADNFSIGTYASLDDSGYVTVTFPVPVTTIEQFDLATGVWTACEGDVNIREAGACVMERRIYIVGGINGGHYYSNLIQCFEPSEDNVRVVDRFPSRIYGRTCCILTLPQYV